MVAIWPQLMLVVSDVEVSSRFSCAAVERVRSVVLSGPSEYRPR